MISSKSSVVLTALVLAATLAGCSGSTDGVASPAPTTSQPAPVASVEPEESEAPATPSAAPACDTIISENAVASLTGLGWTSKQHDFVIGDVTLPDGVFCIWGDYTVPSDHVQVYGWSEISDEDAATAQASLLASGWTREDGEAGIYVTENPEASMGVDENGYGMTYLFGDGWVKVADTKESLLFVEWPPVS